MTLRPHESAIAALTALRGRNESMARRMVAGDPDPVGVAIVLAEGLLQVLDIGHRDGWLIQPEEVLRDYGLWALEHTVDS